MLLIYKRIFFTCIHLTSVLKLKSGVLQNFRSAEEIVQDDEGPETTAVEELQRKLEETYMLCQSMLSDNQPMGLLARQQSAGILRFIDITTLLAN